jgi:ribosomal 30S subunit maturation factor RimM
VIDVQAYPGQEMAFIILDDDPEKEFLVPLVDEFILSINEPVRSITFAVPDGLLAL